VTNNEQRNTHPTVFLFTFMIHSPNCPSFLLHNSSCVIDLCAEVFGTNGNEFPVISKKSKKRLQNKLDNIRQEVNIVKDNEAHERRESVFATYAAAKMAFTRASSKGPHRKRHGGERRKSQLDFDLDENGGRKKTKNATNPVARAVAITPVVSKAKPVAKRAVTIEKKLAKRACAKKSVKKASVNKASVKKASVKLPTPKDDLEKTTPVKPIKEPNEILDTAVVVARSLATTSDAALLAFSADVTPPAAGFRVAVTCSGSVYTAPDDDTVPIQSESDSEYDDGDVDDDDDDNDVVVQVGVLTPLKQVAMTPPRLVVASLSPVLPNPFLTNLLTWVSAISSRSRCHPAAPGWARSWNPSVPRIPRENGCLMVTSLTLLIVEMRFSIMTLTWRL
jgi:hypothetical protein